MAKKAPAVHSVQFSVTFDSTGFTFKAPPNTAMRFRDHGDGTYHLSGAPDGYQIANNKGPKKPPRKKPVGGTTKKKK